MSTIPSPKSSGVQRKSDTAVTLPGDSAGRQLRELLGTDDRTAQEIHAHQLPQVSSAKISIGQRGLDAAQTGLGTGRRSR
ncbi:MAG: hypothetical protein ACTHWO_03000 [Nesterenkonia sp.]